MASISSTRILTCQNCHTPKGERGAPIFERDLSSGLSWDEPPFKVTASNITQDKETGIGNWSDADIKKALQKGERPSGVRLAAIMPSDFYEIFTPGDLDAVVAYLRTVKPVKQETPAPIYRIALPRHIPPGAEKPFSEADMADKVKKGFYLVTIGHCMECHTPLTPRGRDFESSSARAGSNSKAHGACRCRATHFTQGERHRGVDRCRDQARDHRAVCASDGFTAQAADGLWFYKNMTGRMISTPWWAVSAHGAAEGVRCDRDARRGYRRCRVTSSASSRRSCHTGSPARNRR